MSRLSVLLVLLFCLPAQSAMAAWDESQLEGLKWREVGPYRGGCEFGALVQRPGVAVEIVPFLGGLG